MKKSCSIILFFSMLIITFSCNIPASKKDTKSDPKSPYPSSYIISTEGDWFIVNDEKCYIKGVQFFEKHDDPDHPMGYKRMSLSELDYEFKRIKAAGFNAIRSALLPDEIELAKQNGLLVFQSATDLYFCDIADVNQTSVVNKTKEIMSYSKNHDNILLYQIDNEPHINDIPTSGGIYSEGKDAIKAFYETLISTIRSYKSNAIISMASFPQAGFLDYSIFDCVSLNLYEDAIQSNSIGYFGYANWFKNFHSFNKPFIISEYGWQVGYGLTEFNETMIKNLSESIKAGATGSFFFTWRAWGKEGEGPNLWYGIVPNDGTWESYKYTPRSIYNELKQYFEAVIIEPKTNNVYISNIPVQIYGSDKTNSAEVIFDSQTYDLNKDGEYWWKKDISISPLSLNQKSFLVRTKDSNNDILVEKTINIYTSNEDKYIKVQIEDPVLTVKDFTATIKLTDQSNDPVPFYNIKYGLHQSGISMFTSEPSSDTTDINGECSFAVNNLTNGYFTLFAGPDNSSDQPYLISDVYTTKIQ